MYHAIVFLPLIGFLIAGLFGRLIGARPSEIVTTALLGISALLSWIAFVHVGFGGGGTRVQVAQWFASGDLVVDWAFRIDTLTVVMLVVVNTVSALVHLYSIGYMAEDPHRPRFFAYLSLFTFAMLMLDGRQPRADVLRLGGRRLGELFADRLLVPEGIGERRGH